MRTVHPAQAIQIVLVSKTVAPDQSRALESRRMSLLSDSILRYSVTAAAAVSARLLINWSNVGMMYTVRFILHVMGRLPFL